MSERGTRFATGELPAIGDVYSPEKSPCRWTVRASDLAASVDWSQYRLVERAYQDTVLQYVVTCELCGRSLAAGTVVRGRTAVVREGKGGQGMFVAACARGACLPAGVLGHDRNGVAVRQGMKVRATTRTGMTCLVQEVVGGTHFVGPHLERGKGFFAHIQLGLAEVVPDDTESNQVVGTELDEAGAATRALEACVRWLAEPTEQQIRERKYEWFRAAVAVAVAEEPAFTAVTDFNDQGMSVWITVPLVGEESRMIMWDRSRAAQESLNYFERATRWVRRAQLHVHSRAGNAVLRDAREKRTP